MKHPFSCLWILCCLFMVSCQFYEDYKVKEIATEETEAWKAYYAKDPKSLFKHLRNLLVLLYGLDKNDPQTSDVANKFVIAMDAFREMPHDSSWEAYEKNVLTQLTESYAALKENIHAHWNPKDVAESDLAWWVARRDPATNNPESVGQKMAKLYELLYENNTSHHFSKAAYLRAIAARYRDLCESDWTIDQEDWSIIRSILEKSYTELALGIEINQESKTK